MFPLIESKTEAKVDDQQRLFLRLNGTDDVLDCNHSSTNSNECNSAADVVDRYANSGKTKVET